MNLAKRILSVMICGMITVSAAALVPQTSLEAEAATFSEVNAPSVFVKQQKSDTCTLASNVMLLRRTALMRGDSDWSSITESACRPTLWYEGVGMYHNYTYKNITVSYQYISGSVTTTLINALKEHPEGIVVYDYDYPHAILLTDYTDGVFYCADPANNVPSGRIKASQALISLSNVDTYWYVSSPDVSFGSSSNNNSSGNNNNGTSSTVNEKWKITSDNGVNMRSGAGTSYSIIDGVPYNATVTVTKKTSSGGYTWGYTTYNGTSGWIVLDFAEKVNSTVTTLKSNSSISSSSIEVGSTVTLKGSATGGTSPYKYAYYYKKKSDTNWTIAKDWSTTTSVSIKPSVAAEYDVCIKVMDSNNNLDKQYFNLTVKKSSLTNKSSLSATTINLGSTVTLKGSATGGTSPYKYAYYYKKTSDTNWTTAKDWSTTTSVSIKPSVAAEYDVCIKVMDSKNNLDKQYFKLTVKKLSLTNKSSLSATTINLGSTVTLKGSATGGAAPYKYAYYYKKTSDTSWTTAKDWSTTTSVSIKPSASTQYDVCIKVMDSDKEITKQYFTLTVK
ncbi:MAG: SH3 domain-containing protein [Clostridia bacterium]|nr:SH3 domain-containing protein [Clostridia bacterium]